MCYKKNEVHQEMKKRQFFPRSLSVMLCLLVCAGLISAQTVTLKVIETTDVHGTIYPYDFINDKKTAGSLAQVHAYVRAQRVTGDQHNRQR